MPGLSHSVAKDDRRVRKTRKLLSDALRSLLLEKGYESVTIQEILDRADVGRSTFYTHFESKEHLLVGQEPMERLIAELNEPRPGLSEKPQINFLALFQHVIDNAELAKSAIGTESGDILLNLIRENLYFRIVEHYGLPSGSPRREIDMFLLTAEASASALIRMLEGWIERNLPFTAEEMTVKCQQLLDRLLGS